MMFMTIHVLYLCEVVGSLYFDVCCCPRVGGSHELIRKLLVFSVHLLFNIVIRLVQYEIIQFLTTQQPDGDLILQVSESSTA